MGTCSAIFLTKGLNHRFSSNALNLRNLWIFPSLEFETIIRCMRTTLDIDDDVLQAAKELARRQGKTAGRIVSELAWRGLIEARSTSPARLCRDATPFPFRVA